MCLSLKFVGTCVKISALLVMLLGVIGIVCAVSIGKDDIMVSSVQDTKKTIMGVTIAFSVFLILLGLAGTIGAWRNSACCLAIYNVGIGIFFVAFLIISIVAFAVFKKYTTVDVKNQGVCESQDWLTPLNKLAVTGEDYLCSNECACNTHEPLSLAQVVANVTVNETTNDTTNDGNNGTGNDVVHTNSSDKNASNRSYNYSANGSVRVQDCPNYLNDFSFSERELAVTMEILEKQFQCSGICRNPEYFSFSDINGGEPKDDCATVLVDIFVSYSKKIGAATIVMTILLFLTLVASFCLCCHPDKRKEEGGFYSKMSSI